MISIATKNNANMKSSLTSSIIVLIVNVIIFKLYLLLSKEKELQKFNAVYEQQLELCNQHMREQESVMMDFRNIRHDIKHHYIILLEMIDKNKNKMAMEYLESLITSIPRVGISCSDNIVIDSLINAKNAIAIQDDIDFKIDVHIPIQLPFRSADLCILLGNLLDNAIEASYLLEEAQRSIRLYMKYDKNILIITVLNNYNGYLVKERNGKIITSKRDSTNHGIGLESVNKVASKYYGSMVIETKDNIFKVKVLLCDRS